MKGFYSPIERLLEQSTRGKGTGTEFMTELSKQPGYKQAEVEDRDLQTLMALPKMAREEFMAQLKAKPGVAPKERVFRGKVAPKDLTYEEEYERQNKGIDSEVHHEEHTLPGGENYREILLQHPKGNFPGVGAHFGGAPNVLASIRVKDRTGPNGEKILHLEEIQSDWHQQGRKKGYAPKDVDLKEQARRAKLKHTMVSQHLKEAKERSESIDRDLASDAPLFQDPVVRERLAKAQIGYNDKIMDLMPEVMKAESAHRDAEQMSKYGIPDAPFKKNWHELALKRMIQHAAENGYDQIHVTPGETQAQRWGAKDEGAKGFYDLYDKQIPQFLNKFGKQYGAQVQPATSREHPVSKVAPHFNRTEEQFNALPEDRQADMRRGYEYSQGQLAPGTPTHSFQITPEMRQDVLKNGIPMYAEGGSVQPLIPRHEADANLAKFLKDSYITHRVYHGTGADIRELKPSKIGALGPGIYVTSVPKEASEYAHVRKSINPSENPNVMPLHVQVKNPFSISSINNSSSEFFKHFDPEGKLSDDEVIELAKKRGHDAVHARLEGVTNVFSPHQIKSATGNRGTYDTSSPELSKAKGGVVSRETIKPVAHGIIKERVTVSPNLDAMQYELLSAKHFTKKVK